MRKFTMMAAAAAALLTPVLSATAEARPYYGNGYGYRGDVRQERNECRRELRRADSRREYQRELRECRREISRARNDRRDWNRDGWRERNDRRSGYYRDNYDRRW